MNQKQSEDFDDLVKKVAADADGPYHEESWHKMEYLLNKRKRKRFVLFFWPLGLLIFGTTILAIVKYFPSTSETSALHPLPILSSHEYLAIKPNPYSLKVTADQIFGQRPLHVEVSQIGPANHPATPNITDLTETTNPAPNAAPFTSKSSIRGQNIPGHSSSTGNNKNQSKSLGKATFDAKVPLSGNIHRSTTDALSKDSKAPSTSPDPASILAKVDPDSKTPDHVIGSRPSILNKMTGIEALSSLRIAPFDFDRAIHLKHWNDHMPISTKTPRHTSLNFGFGWSPEYTSVVQRSYSQLGKAYGVDLGFKVGKFTLGVGLQKSTKYYNAMKEDYEIPYDSYYKKLTIKNIKGVCSVVQLPIQLKYDLIRTKSFLLVVNTGVSSMRMDKEIYTYDYFHANSKPGHSVDDYALKNWHWLAAASTGISVQKSISRHLGVSFTPYYQLPLKGVGEGHVRLRSFGSQFALSWSIPTSK